MPKEIKHERFERLKKLYESIIPKNNQEYIGTNQEILVEGYSKTNNEYLTGRTDTNKVVIFKGSPELIGKMANIQIASEHMWSLIGEIK